jgi:hypothetical protein
MISPALAESATPAPPRSKQARRSRRQSGTVGAVATVGLLLAIAIPIRVIVAHQSLFADELSTYWIVAQHGLGTVISLLAGKATIDHRVITHAEISPPLFFVLSWTTAQISHAPELIRAPSVVAGVLSIPAVYLVGQRTVGRGAALVAGALTTLSPFMVYYSSEARSYALMMLLATLSTLAMLLAVERGGVRWWVAYAVCSAGAVYSHYTCVFVLLAQFGWLVVTHPEARRQAVLANVGALIALIPWTGGFVSDLNSPTSQILSALSPFTVHDVRIGLEHWALGFPYLDGGGLTALPGSPALILFGLCAVVVIVGIARRARGAGIGSLLARVDARVWLIVLLAISVPVGEILVSAVSTHIFGVRNLAASWPPLGLAAGAAIMAAGPRLRILAAALAIVGFGLGTAKLFTVRYARSDFQGAATYIAHHWAPGDVVLDGTGILSPGPLTGLDVALHTPAPVIRVGAPAERTHPFGVFDPVQPAGQAVRTAVAAARGHRIFFVRYVSPGGGDPVAADFPARYRVVAERPFRNFAGLTLDVWADGRRS